MKKTLNILFLSLLIFCFSCGDEEKSEAPSGSREQSAARETVSKISGKETATSKSEKPEPVAVVDGRYRKLVDKKPAADCNCNCIEIDFDKPTEWCIVKDKVYITAQARKTGENSADLYFLGVSRENEPDRPLPWDDFDTDKPIASIAFEPNGDAEVDWTGFSVGGEIATDYAIFGKKSLEGTYKKD